MFKILEGLVPNCGLDLSNNIEDRIGRYVSVPKIIKNSPTEVKRARNQSFHYNGARLFNSIPKYLRNRLTQSPQRLHSIFEFK